jgi:hypothetical protein
MRKTILFALLASIFTAEASMAKVGEMPYTEPYWTEEGKKELERLHNIASFDLKKSQEEERERRRQVYESMRNRTWLDYKK